NSRLAQNYSVAFDASVQEIFSAWFCGASLFPIPEDIQINPPHFLAWLKENAISYWDTVPSLWYQIVSHIISRASEGKVHLPDLKTVVLGGEVLRGDEIGPWFNSVDQDHKLFNVYGPTEATVTSSFYRVS